MSSRTPKPTRNANWISSSSGREVALLLLQRLTVELDAVGQRLAQLHHLGRTDVRALIAIMDAARTGSAPTAGGLGAAVELSSARRFLTDLTGVIVRHRRPDPPPP